MPKMALLLTLALALGARAQESPPALLNELYAQVYRLQDAREFLKETIQGIEDGTKLYIKTATEGFVVAEKLDVTKSLALAVSSRKMTEKKAGEILARMEDESLGELPRLRGLLEEIEREIRGKNNVIASLRNSIASPAPTLEPTAEGKDAGQASVDNGPDDVGSNSGALTSEDTTGHASQSDALGREWVVKEPGTYGTWTRRPGSSLFDAAWYVGGKVVKGVIYVAMDGRRVEAQRIGKEGDSECVYRGELKDDGVTVEGTYECKGIDSASPWEAKIAK